LFASLRFASLCFASLFLFVCVQCSFVLIFFYMIMLFEIPQAVYGHWMNHKIKFVKGPWLYKNNKDTARLFFLSSSWIFKFFSLLCVSEVCVGVIIYIYFFFSQWKKYFLTSSHDKTRFYLKRGSDILMSNCPARVRIWVISTVIAPNKHISCKSCSSRTRPSVTATMIVDFLYYCSVIILSHLFFL